MEPYFSFQWHLTDACDQRCTHCYIYAGGSRTGRDVRRDEMRDILANMDDMCRALSRRPYLYLTGGDPVLHPDFLYLTGLLKEREIPFQILGNPFHLTRRLLSRLKEDGCRAVQLSLDGLEETHDRIRRPGSFRETLEAVPRIREAGIGCVIMTTVSGMNISEVSDVFETACRAGADVYAFARYCPAGEEKENGIAPRAYRGLLVRCREKEERMREEGYSTRLARKDHLWALLDWEEGRWVPESGQEREGCHCAAGHLTILPDGTVMGCRRAEETRVGNALEKRLLDIWNYDMNRYRRFESFEKCASCPLLDACRGCPAVASACGRGFYGADPQCWKE